VRNDRGTPLAFLLVAPALSAVGFIKVAALNWGKKRTVTITPQKMIYQMM
jgi:hypothetical protein